MSQESGSTTLNLVALIAALAALAISSAMLLAPLVRDVEPTDAGWCPPDTLGIANASGSPDPLWTARHQAYARMLRTHRQNWANSLQLAYDLEELYEVEDNELDRAAIELVASEEIVEMTRAVSACNFQLLVAKDGSAGHISEECRGMIESLQHAMRAELLGASHGETPTDKVDNDG